MHSYKAIGVMSGTSLDGLDIVLCNFTFKEEWTFNILKAVTIDYSKEWKDRLSNAPLLNGYELILLHKEFGRFIGESINTFLQNTDEKIDIVASHGHTVFHQPEKKITLQIGDGFEIASSTNILSICDFRSLDVTIGGQGAPLVPLGDALLFNEYDYCLNIGGFANISYEKNNSRFAYDICPANIILNYLANKSGQAFDKNGALGILGKTNSDLLNKLNQIEYYQKQQPKSLGKEWLDQIFTPILENYNISINDKIRTVYEHIALQISKAINQNEKLSQVLITGGGAYNKLLINLIKQKSNTVIIIPDEHIIEYKEALIFALLGILRYENKINCLSSVTGANRDSSSGVIYLP